jgi:pimeloyl-ACP methyl ester carboxylesterase
VTTIDLAHGTVNYRTAGPSDSNVAPVVFVHGFLVDGSLWSSVTDLLALKGIRSYAPDLPLGSHRTPMRPEADQSPRGVARLILSFLEALDLQDVTLVGNDTGGALCQFVLDTDASRIGRVVLTNCDAFESFPPFPFNLVFRLLKGGIRMAVNLQPMRFRVFRHSPIGFGLLANELDAAQTKAWITPSLEHTAIRADAVRFLREAKSTDLLDVSTRLERFEGPVSIVWGIADRAFTPALGRRLQQAFRSALFVEIPKAKTFVSLDAPVRLADEIANIASPTIHARDQLADLSWRRTDVVD